MPRGQDTRDHQNRQPRRIGQARPTPYFSLSDSAHQVAQDWAQGNNTALGRFATRGEVDKNIYGEIDTHLNSGETHPHEKERLTNLKKYIQAQTEEN